MLNWLIEPIINAFDPLYVDERCELQKEKDKKGAIVISCILTAIIIIPNLLDFFGIINL